MKLRRPRLTYANIVATIALFAALGGVSYAATTLPSNSVGSKQIQAEAVRTGKLAEDAVTASKLSQGVRNRIADAAATPAATSAPESVKHAETSDMAATANTAVSADTAKDAEALGGQPAGHYLTADSVLQSGQTEAGDYIAAASNGQAGTVLVQFWPHLPESVQEGHIKVIPEGGGPTTECPGAGQAIASYMCVYQSFNEGMTFESFISTMPGSIYAGPLSGVMTWRSNQSNGLLRGTWAYTAP